MIEYCCPTFREHIEAQCEQCGDRRDCPDTILEKYSSDAWNKDKWGIPVHDGGTSFVQIYFCPWCGAKT